MRSVTHLILVVIFHVVVVREVLSECHQNKQQLLVEKYEGMTEEFLIWRGLVVSKMECIHACYYDLRCITFQYSQSGACGKFSTTIDVLKSYKNGTEMGVIAVQLPWKGGFGEVCIYDDECHFPNSECRDFTCGCIIGYSFNPVENACTNGCTVYGNSYSTFPDTGFSQFDLSDLTTDSPEACKNFCSSMSNCKSGDYLQSKLQCYVKWRGAADDPSRLFQLSGVLHFVRNCYN